VNQYRLDEASVPLLADAADGLFDWVQPALPEDLCLLRLDGTPWLVNIAHEEEAWLMLPDEEYQQLVGKLPQLAAHLTY
jgi:hypothetical protein